MSAPHDLIVVPGTSPLVLVAPHGGSRDPARRPWGDGARKVNDLHTATLTAELAAATGAAALINAAGDRNDVDLNRLSAAHDRAPHFLERLDALLDAAIARHGHAVVATIHGWNVVQPAVDVGLGCAPGTVDGGAVSAAFAATTLAALRHALEAHGIATTLGARYPARARENLLQLFTRRYHDDPRPLVRALAARGACCEALQLECSIPLRWPGAWRARLVDAITAALGGPRVVRPRVARAPESPVAQAAPRTLQLTSPSLSGLASLDPIGGRLLLFPPDGGLVLFTGERVGPCPGDGVAALVMAPTPGGGLRLEYDGPVLRFPDTAPFLDLEHGLRRAALADAHVRLAFTPRHERGEDAGEFGTVTGCVVLGDVETRIDGRGFADARLPMASGPGVRGALALADGTGLSFTAARSGPATGFRCGPSGHATVDAVRVDGPLGPDPDRFTVTAALADGSALTLPARIVDRLPVVRMRPDGPSRALFVTCAVGDAGGPPAGWCEIDGL